jgi:hypothetical protein
MATDGQLPLFLTKEGGEGWGEEVFNRLITPIWGVCLAEGKIKIPSLRLSPRSLLTG